MVAFVGYGVSCPCICALCPVLTERSGLARMCLKLGVASASVQAIPNSPSVVVWVGLLWLQISLQGADFHVEG